MAKLCVRAAAQLSIRRNVLSQGVSSYGVILISPRVCGVSRALCKLCKYIHTQIPIYHPDRILGDSVSPGGSDVYEGPSRYRH
jgi:hypothetical protein